MNCYRCGFDFSGPECQVCGKQAPTEENITGGDSDLLRIAVIVPAKSGLTDPDLDQARKNCFFFRDEPEDSGGNLLFVYTPRESRALFDVLHLTESTEGRKVLFNGRQRPYDADLWLPLLWYLARE